MSSPSCPARRQCRLGSTVLCTISTAGLPRRQLRRNQSTLRPKKAARPRALKCQSPTRRLSRPLTFTHRRYPSPAASKLMDQLDELASDLAAKGRSSSEEAVETIPETSHVSVESQAVGAFNSGASALRFRTQSVRGGKSADASAHDCYFSRRLPRCVARRWNCLAIRFCRTDKIDKRVRTSPRQNRLPLRPLSSLRQRRRRPNRCRLRKPRRPSHRPNWRSNSRQWRKTWPRCGVVLSNSPPSRNSLPPPNNSWINSPPNKRNSSPSRNSWRKISRNCRRQSKP